jgi:hypothetical protein
MRAAAGGIPVPLPADRRVRQEEDPARRGVGVEGASWARMVTPTELGRWSGSCTRTPSGSRDHGTGPSWPSTVTSTTCRVSNPAA